MRSHTKNSAHTPCISPRTAIHTNIPPPRLHPNPSFHRRIELQNGTEPLIVCLPFIPTAIRRDNSALLPQLLLPDRFFSSTDNDNDVDDLPLSSASTLHHDTTTTQLAPRNLEVHLDNEPPKTPSREKSPDYYANVGDAIRTLREDFPLLFAKDPNYDIYREDIVFKDPNLSFKGLKNYKLIIWSIKFHGRLFFKRIFIDVTRIWQPDDSQIKMRWRVHAYPRVWWESEGIFDAISTYKLDNKGRIYEHSVDNVQLRDPPITNPLLYGLNWLVRPVPQPQIYPGGSGTFFTPGIGGVGVGVGVGGGDDLTHGSAV
jgi:hypothetical protein